MLLLQFIIYKSIAIKNYYLLKVQNTINTIAKYSDSEVLVIFFIFLNFVFGRVFTEKFQNEIQKFNLG